MTCEAVHCFDKASVRFAIYPDGPEGPRVLGEISEGALRDVFGARGDSDSLVEACKAHFDTIESCALAHFSCHSHESLELGIDDFRPGTRWMPGSGLAGSGGVAAAPAPA